MKRFQTQPSIEIAPQTPSTDKSFDDFDGLIQSRTSSSHSGQTAIHYSRETIKDPNHLDISPENITKTHSMTDFGTNENSKPKTRKVSSDNSLKKLSIKNLPSLLRSLSSQTNINTNKIFKASNAKKSRSYHRSAENMCRLASHSCEAIDHQLSDTVLNKRRSTAYELYASKPFDCSDVEDNERKNLIEENIKVTHNYSDERRSDCRDSVPNVETIVRNIDSSILSTTEGGLPIEDQVSRPN